MSSMILSDQKRMVNFPLVNASIVTQWLLLPVSDEYELSVKIVRGLGDSLLVAAAAPRSLGAGHEEECGEGRQPGHQHRDQDRRAASTDPEHLISPAFNVGRMSLFQETNVFNHKEANFLPFDLMIISRSVSSSTLKMVGYFDSMQEGCRARLPVFIFRLPNL